MTIKINVFNKQQQKIQVLSIKELNNQDKKLQQLTKEKLKRIVGGLTKQTQQEEATISDAPRNHNEGGKTYE